MISEKKISVSSALSVDKKEKVSSSALHPYPSYQDSGVPWFGKIPSGWELRPGFSALRFRKVKNLGMQENQVLSLSYGQIIIKPPKKLHGLVPESFETYQIAEPGNPIIRGTDL